MLTRFHKILGAVLVLQIALAVIMHLRGDDRAVAKEAPMLAGFDAAKVTRVQIINDSKTLDLVKKGTTWVLASAFDYPTGTAKVEDALAPLAKLTAGTPVATQKTRHKQLNVDDNEFGSKVTLTVEGKDIALFIGSSAGGRRTAVRRGGEDNVYAVNGVSQSTFSGHASQWIDKTYVAIEREQIASIKIERPGSVIDLAKQPGTPDAVSWTATIDGAPLTIPAGEKISTLAIDGVVNNLTSLSADDPGDPKRDASKPIATITVTLVGKDATPAPPPVVIDVVDDGGKVWVRQRGLDRAIVLDKGRLDAVLSLAKEKLVEKVVEAPVPTGLPTNLPEGVTQEMIQEALKQQGMGGMVPPQP